MHKKYKVYSVSLSMPMIQENMAPGCTSALKDGIERKNIKVFDELSEAEKELERHTSMVYPRFECRKAYYEVTEWYLDEITLDGNGSDISSRCLKNAKMDLSYVEDQNDYMP